jgi:hypothetical protein
MAFAVLLVLCLHSYAASAQAAPALQSVTKQESTPLYDEIARMDAAMFAAFNAHDADILISLFSENIEFYHDLGGLQSFSDIKFGFKRMFAQNNGMRRELVDGTPEVYPIKDYGAIEAGTHRFCHNEEGKEICGTFKFLHIWQRKGTTWKVTRVVSYGH